VDTRVSSGPVTDITTAGDTTAGDTTAGVDRRALLLGIAALAVSACAPAASTPGRAAGSPTTGGTEPAPTTAAAPTTTVTTTTVTTTNTGATGAPGVVAGVDVVDGAGRAAFVQRGPGTRREVALTFHTNGDTGLVTRLLDRLAARQVPITAFVIGDWLDEHPDLARRLVADGHEPANHSWSHPAMGELDRAAVRDEIDRCAAVLQRLTGTRSRWFRPSAVDVPGDDIRLAAADAGYRTVVGYSLDSRDHTDPGATAVVDTVTSTIRAGDIVSLHFDHAGTITAIDPIVDHLRRVGLRPVTVGTLLAR